METLRFDLGKNEGKFKILNATNGGPYSNDISCIFPNFDADENRRFNTGLNRRIKLFRFLCLLTIDYFTSASLLIFKIKLFIFVWGYSVVLFEYLNKSGG